MPLVTLINTKDGGCERLGEDYYVVAFPGKRQWPYKNGTIVRAITGIAGSNNPGFNLDDNMMTVCRIDAKVAEHCGVPKHCLIKLINFPI